MSFSFSFIFFLFYEHMYIVGVMDKRNIYYRIDITNMIEKCKYGSY